jgi:anti-sigma B factor antagonist
VEQHDPIDQFGRADVALVDGRWVLRLAGEISFEMRPRLDRVVSELGVDERPVDVDLGEVTFMDSSGIGFLARLAIENPERVRVHNARGLTRELLAISGLGRVLSIDPE